MKESQLKVFSGSSNPELVKKICDCIGIAAGEVTVTSFPDGETFVKFTENIRGDDIFIVQSTSVPANHHIMELLIMIDAARRASARRITAVIPFYGYARQDRKDQPRVPITSKLVANLLVAAGANRILTMDLHAQQIQGFFDIPVDHLYASPVVYDYLRTLKTESLTVFSPDVGGMKMAAAYADLLGCPLGFCAKRRMNAQTVEAFNIVGEVKGCDILIVDDMTETAGTLTAAAKLLKENGAKSVMAAVSHGTINEIGFERLAQGYIDRLITTDTVKLDVGDLPIKILTVSSLLAEAIKRIHGNSSVTSLFRVKGY
ncbi:MAG: ribose-phosphate pyrophosphokinase [Verrucomicrobiota bacterium]